MHIIIVSPSLDSTKNVSGVSSVTQFIIDNNRSHKYLHFELGRKDKERRGICRLFSIIRKYGEWKCLLKKNPDAIIHYNFPLDKQSILRDTPFMHVALKYNNKMVVHIHGGKYLTTKNVQTPYRQILKTVFSWQVPFITLSEKEVETIKKKFHAKHVISLPNCVDLRDATAYEREYKDESQPLTLGYLGRIARTKGMDYLLKACTLLKKRNISFHLKLAGAEEVEGQYLPQFKNVLGNQFEYSGVVFGENKNEYLQSLDILIMPTFYEGLPISLLECMSYGTVPVITPVGSIPSIVTDLKTGLFIKLKDTESIVNAIIYLHTHRDKLEQMSKASRDYIFQHFNPKTYINNLNNIYNTC